MSDAGLEHKSVMIKLKNVLQLFMLVITFNTILAQTQYGLLGLFDGDACPMRNGNQGVCRELKYCRSEYNRLRNRQRGPFINPVLCSFSGSSRLSTPVVCCENTLTTGNRQWRYFPRVSPWNSYTSKSTRPWNVPTNPTIIIPARMMSMPTDPPAVTPASMMSTNPPKVTPSTTNAPSTSSVATVVGTKSKEACEDLANEIDPPIIPLVRGGVKTIRGEFPHMALVGYASIDNESALVWDCGGALISNRYVLTAAHCVIITSRQQHGPPIRIRLGEYDLNRDNDGERDYGIEQITPHQNYNLQSWYNDIALIRLNQTVKYSTRIMPACLYTNPVQPPGDLVITGWGLNSESGERNSILQKGNQTLNPVPASECDLFYSNEIKWGRLRQGVTNAMFCALDPAGSVDSCKGDSGGPLQLLERTDFGTYSHVVGVTSAGPPCAEASDIKLTVPGIYARVYNYLGWIEDIVWPS